MVGRIIRSAEFDKVRHIEHTAQKSAVVNVFNLGRVVSADVNFCSRFYGSIFGIKFAQIDTVTASQILNE